MSLNFNFLLSDTNQRLLNKLKQLGGLFFSFKQITYIFDEFTLKNYVVIDYDFPARITRFRTRDVIISASSVSMFLDFAKMWNNIERFEVYYVTPDDNIFPFLDIRADGRLEIPSRINRKYRIREQVEQGITYFTLTLRLVLVPESKELTVYISYMKGMFGGKGKDREYKVTAWYPILFMYKDYTDLFENIKEVYSEELIDLWYYVYCWFMGVVPRQDLTLGITNREKDYILSDADYEKVRALVLDLSRQVIYYDKVGFKHEIEKAVEQGLCGWDVTQYGISYPECTYDIFLDLDDFILIKNGFYCIDDYINKHLIPILNKNNVHGKIYIILSSKRFLQYNYHIIVQSNLQLGEWYNIDSELIEHDIRKVFHRLQRFSVLRISEKAGSIPEIIKVIEI